MTREFTSKYLKLIQLMTLFLKRTSTCNISAIHLIEGPSIHQMEMYTLLQICYNNIFSEIWNISLQGEESKFLFDVWIGKVVQPN